jgi:hypothetical protein
LQGARKQRRFRRSVRSRRQPTISADPGEGPFNNPAFWQDDEAMCVAAFNDLQGPAAGVGDYLRHLRPLIAGIGEANGNQRRAQRSNWRAPSRSCTSAEWTTTFSRRPSLSTRIWRLRPVTFLPASKPCGSSAEPLFEPLCLLPRRYFYGLTFRSPPISLYVSTRAFTSAEIVRVQPRPKTSCTHREGKIACL